MFLLHLCVNLNLVKFVSSVIDGLTMKGHLLWYVSIFDLGPFHQY